MPKFIVPVTFKFEGAVEVETLTEEEAKSIVESGFGSTLNGGPHTNDDRVTDWSFNVHPQREVSEAAPKPAERERGPQP
jgi:hypothetical protein